MNDTEYNTNKHEPIEEVLTHDQIVKAEEWLRIHRKHVCNIVMLVNKNFPPTLSEDKNNPNLWKAGHWRWYLDETKI